MEQIDIVTTVSSQSYGELSSDDRRLIDAARAATRGSYAPYSHFRVGAAILLANGEVVTGANQENAAFPSGTCAERSAAFWAGANYPDVPFVKIAVAAIAPDGREPAMPVAPCGACRQALLEYEKLAGAPVPVMLAGADTVYTVPSVKNLLPLAFSNF